MSLNSPVAIILSALASPLFAGELVPTTGATLGTPPSDEFNLADLFNAAEVKYIGSFGMDFDNSVGELNTHAFQASAFLSKPVNLPGGWQFLPEFGYEAMLLDTDGPLPSLLVGDEDLHEIDLSLYFMRIDDSDPWVFGAWLNPSLSTDFQGVGSDDFFLDVAAGGGYRFSDDFMAGFGFGAFNVTGDMNLYPGVGLFWTPTDQTLVAIYGPTFTATHEINSNWRVGAEVRPNGGIWNIDNALGSMNIDYTAFRAGLTSSHRLAGELWLSYGGGATFANSFNVTTTDGSKIFQNQLDELDSGFYGFVSLDLKSW